jgi:guanylate kinase
VCEREMERRGYKRIISYTTRPKRDNEQYDIDYHYISKEEFLEKKSQGFFAEHTIYRGWFYGISQQECIDDAVAVIEPIGFRRLQKNKDLNITSFFIKTSDRTRMIRMLQRGDDIMEAIRRLFSDQGSFACIDEEVNFTIINEGRTVKETVDEIIGKLKEVRD